MNRLDSSWGAGIAPGTVAGVAPPPAVEWSTVDWAAVAELRSRVAGRLQATQRETGGLAEVDERALAAGLITEEIEQWALARARGGEPVPQRASERALAAAVLAALYGLGRLQPLLDRDDVENVHIHGCDQVVLELAGGRWESVSPVADSDGELIEMLARFAARCGQTAREFSAAQPVLNLRLPAGGPLGSRLAAVVEVADRPAVAIRRHRLPTATLTQLAEFGTITEAMAAFLAAAVRAGLNVVVSGAPAVGKTTLLHALAAEIPATEHVVTVEEEYELGLHVDGSRRLVTALETRQANAEGAGEIGLHALLRQALRHSPSRVLVGEVRGGEVTALLLALSNGAAGGMCTLHARSASAVLTRIAQLAHLSEPPLPAEAAWRFTADAVDLIVHLDRDAHGRFVTEILEVGQVGDGGLPDTTVLFSAAAGGRAAPAYSPSSWLRQRLVQAGFDPGWLQSGRGLHPTPYRTTGAGGSR